MTMMAKHLFYTDTPTTPRDRETWARGDTGNVSGLNGKKTWITHHVRLTSPPISSIRACGSCVRHTASHTASTSALQAIQFLTFQRPGHAPKFSALLISDMRLLSSVVHRIRRHRAPLHTPSSRSPRPPPHLLLSSPARSLRRSLLCCLGRFSRRLR